MSLLLHWVYGSSLMQIALKYVELFFLSLLGTDSTDTMMSCKTHTHIGSDHQVTDKNIFEPELLQSLQKLVILGQVKVITRQRKETLMTVVCQVFGLELSRELQLNPYLLFYMNKRCKIYYSTRESKKKVHKTHFATSLLIKKIILTNCCWVVHGVNAKKEKMQHSNINC